MAISREESTIKGATENRKSSGWFGQFNRGLIGSDPYTMEIKNSEHLIGTMKIAQQYLDQAENVSDDTQKMASLNTARRLLGMRQVDNNFRITTGVRSEQEQRRRVIDSTENMEAEQKALDASESFAKNSIIIAGTAPIGLGAVGLKAAAMAGARAGAASGLGSSLYDNWESKKSFMEARRDDVVNTVSGAVMGAGGGTLGYGVGRLGGKTLENVGRTKTLGRMREAIGGTFNALRSRLGFKTAASADALNSSTVNMIDDLVPDNIPLVSSHATSTPVARPKSTFRKIDEWAGEKMDNLVNGFRNRFGSRRIDGSDIETFLDSRAQGLFFTTFKRKGTDIVCNFMDNTGVEIEKKIPFNDFQKFMSTRNQVEKLRIRDILSSSAKKMESRMINVLNEKLGYPLGVDGYKLQTLLEQLNPKGFSLKDITSHDWGDTFNIVLLDADKVTKNIVIQTINIP